MQPSLAYRPRLWHLVLIVVMGAFELLVAWMALHPQVAPDYRAYYIDRTASCFPREITGYYPLGEPISFSGGRPGYSRDSTRWCGFLPPNPTGIRTFGDYGILQLRFPDPHQDLFLTFTSYASVGNNQPARDVGVVVNGQKVATMTFHGPQRILERIVLPASLITRGKGLVEIRFDVPRTGPPGTNSEPQTLQFRLLSLRLVPMSDTKEPRKFADATPPPASVHDLFEAPPAETTTGRSGWAPPLSTLGFAFDSTGSVVKLE